MSNASTTYEKSAPNHYRWTSEAYDAIIAGTMTATIVSQGNIQTARVNGPCPRCGHEVHFSLVLDVVTGERSGTLSNDSPLVADDEYVPVPVSCQCGEAHEGRPDAVKHGCGINFMVEIESR